MHREAMLRTKQALRPPSRGQPSASAVDASMKLMMTMTMKLEMMTTRGVGSLFWDQSSHADAPSWKLTTNAAAAADRTGGATVADADEAAADAAHPHKALLNHAEPKSADLESTHDGRKNQLVIHYT